MAKMSRDKGKRGEREVARILREHGYDARRGVQYHGGADSPDVIGLPGIHIEVKRTERLNLYDALGQSRGDAGEGESPVVIHRRNDCEWVVIQPISDWLDMYASSEMAVKASEMDSKGRSGEESSVG